MRAVVQRVSSASVTVDQQVVGNIERGLLVLLGVEQQDQSSDASYMSDKLIGLRIFDDAVGKMNLSVTDVGGSILLISQFTLLGDCRKGRRPSFDAAALPDVARSLYEQFVKEISELGIPVATGVFQATMDVELTNQGPVTFILDSRKRF